MRLKDKVVLITGAGRGIGRAAALVFAKEGARVVVNDIDGAGDETVEAIAGTGGQARFVRADVSSEADVRELFDRIVEWHGGLDVLYNNAAIGYSSPITHGDVTELSEADWDKVLDVNLKSVFLCCKYAIPLMDRQGGGSIVNTSSCMGLGATPGADAYTAAKGGIIALSRSLAKAYGAKGIRVNVVVPGTVATPMIQPILDDAEWTRRSSDVPLGRLGTPEDVAHAALYFASDESSFTTGAVLIVDGGRMI